MQYEILSWDYSKISESQLYAHMNEAKIVSDVVSETDGRCKEHTRTLTGSILLLFLADTEQLVLDRPEH